MSTHRFTRRSVLWTAAAAPLAAQSLSPIRLPRTLRLAIIGFDGHPGEITGPLPRLPDIEVVAICSADPNVLARQARNPRLAGARRYTDYIEMLNREQLDLVAVCNNNGERAGAIIASAKRGLNVIAEKPLAINRADFKAVRQAVEQNKVALGMLLPMRFDPPYLALKNAVDAGLIGEVAQISAQKSYKAGERPAWFLNRATYGSTMLWIGIHMVDLMRFTSGREFTQAAGFASRVGYPELRYMENVTATVFQLDNGGAGSLRMDYFRPATAPTHGDDRLRLAGLKGVVEYQAATGVTLMNAERKPVTLPLPPEGPSVFIDYLESTYKGEKPALPVADIWRVNEIVLGANEAMETGAVVRL